jgi:hypothetical protein
MPLPPLASSRQAFTRQRRLARGPSSGFFGLKHQFEANHLIAHQQATLLEALQRELVGRHILTQAVYPGVQISMLDPEFDQASLRGV